MEEKYTAIFPTNSLINLNNCANSLLMNSKKLESIIVIWDGDHNSFLSFSKIPTNCDKRVKYVENPGAHADVYGMYNLGASLSLSEYILFVNDDMYFPRNWDEKILFESKSVITFAVIEPGFVKASEKVIEHSFGFDWNTFEKEEFENFAQNFPLRNKIKDDNLGWYMPVLFSKSLFFEARGYPNKTPFPHQNDAIFFEKLKHINKIRFVQVNSPIYHFQSLSQRKLGLFTKLYYYYLARFSRARALPFFTKH